MTKNGNGLTSTATSNRRRASSGATTGSALVAGVDVAGEIAGTSVAARIDPGVCSSVPAEDARILRERELEELRLLIDACVAWDRVQPGGEIRLVDRPLVDAIWRALRCR